MAKKIGLTELKSEEPLSEPSFFDEFKADELPFSTLLSFQLNDIRQRDSVGDLTSYVGSVNALENLLYGYLKMKTKASREYWIELDNATKKLNKRINGIRIQDERSDLEKADSIEKIQREFTTKKYRALMLFMAKKNFLPRQSLG